MARAETAPTGRGSVRGFDLLPMAWRFVASVQFALALIGFLALAGLLAVVLPQIPEPMRDNPAAIQVWLESRKGTFGPLTEPMHRLGLFSVVTAWWFLTLLVLLAVSVCANTVNRFVPVWRNVTKPQERVPDSFFDRAANRAVLAPHASAPGDAASRLEALLRRRRFRVRRFHEGEAAYLFADRFGWVQLGTFATHLALVLFLAGGLVSRTGGYTSDLFVAEGDTNPVFPVSHPEQMQVEVVDAVGAFDETGSPLDYRTELVIYQGGQEVTRGVTTVNDPLSYDGYRFHQAAYFGEGAGLRVRDAATGRTLYRETLALEELFPAPVITVRDAQGNVLLDDIIVPTESIEGTWGTTMVVPETGRRFWAGVRQDEAEAWHLVVFGLEDEEERLLLAEGAAGRARDLEFTLEQVTGLPFVSTPSTRSPGIPGDNERSLVVMSETPEGTPYLTVLGPVDGRTLTLYPDQPVRIDDREYVFEGRKAFAGIQVRRDPGANFIWAATGLLLAGLLVTFYVPRLRLWARVRRDETVVAGLAEKSASFRTEVQWLKTEMDVEMIPDSQEDADA